MRVRVQTELGDIVVEVDQAKAPAHGRELSCATSTPVTTTAASWHRTVKMDNQPESPVKIEVIQAGVDPARAKEGFPAIALERTSKTGLLHKDGVDLDGARRAGQRDIGMVHLHQRSTVARFRRRAESRRPGLRGVRPRGIGHGRGPEDPGRALVDDAHHRYRRRSD